MPIRPAPALLLLFAASAGIVCAQAPAPSLIESFAVRGGYSSDADVGTGSVAVSHFEVGVSGRFAGGMGLSGLTFKSYQLDATGPLPLPESLQQASVTIGLQHRFSPAWSVLALLRPGFYGDFEKLDGDSFNAPLLILANYSAHPELVWTFGLNLNAVADYPVLPVAGVRWRFAPEWTLNLAFPRTDVTWQVNEALAYSLGVRIEGGTFRVTDSPLFAPGAVRLDNTYLDFTEIRVGAGVSLALNETMKLELEAGFMADRKFDYYDRDYRLNSDAGGFVSLSLNGRF